jgi:hypothetical protein
LWDQARNRSITDKYRSASSDVYQERTRNGKPWVRILVEEEREPESAQRTPNLLPIAFFGRIAERAQELQAGDELTVGCRLQGTKYTTDSGETRHGCQLVGEQIFVAAAVKEASK